MSGNYKKNEFIEASVQKQRISTPIKILSDANQQFHMVNFLMNSPGVNKKS